MLDHTMADYKETETYNSSPCFCHYRVCQGDSTILVHFKSLTFCIKVLNSWCHRVWLWSDNIISINWLLCHIIRGKLLYVYHRYQVYGKMLWYIQKKIVSRTTVQGRRNPTFYKIFIHFISVFFQIKNTISWECYYKLSD